MKKKIVNYIAALLFVATTGGAVLTTALPQTAAAACTVRLLSFPAWYRGVVNDSCDIKSPADFDTTGTDGKKNGDGLKIFIWIVVLNVIEMTLQLVGYLAVAFIIIGGYKYMTSAGSSDGMVKARKTIFNAVIGLILSIASVAIVNVIAGAIK